MATKSANLLFHSTKNSFINLPRSWVSKLPRDKVVVFEVQGENGVLYSSWAGGTTSTTTGESDIVEVNGLFAIKQNLQHEDQVMLSQLTSVPAATQVYVEPLSITDWEILELHAEYIEGNLLNQVRVVWTDQVTPIWVQKNICIFVKIGKTVPDTKCCLLEQDTEVIVTPKARNAQPNNKPSISRPTTQSTLAPKTADSNAMNGEPIKPRARNLSGNKSVEKLKQAAETYDKHSGRERRNSINKGLLPRINSRTSIPDQSEETPLVHEEEQSRFSGIFNYIKSWWTGPQEDSSVSSKTCDNKQKEEAYSIEHFGDEFDCSLRVQSLDEVIDVNEPVKDTANENEITPLGLIENTRSNCLLKQPTNVFISYDIYLTVCKTCKNKQTNNHPKPFLATISKLLSPSEREELQAQKSRKDMFSSRTQSALGKSKEESEPNASDLKLQEEKEENSHRRSVRVVVADWNNHVGDESGNNKSLNGGRPLRRLRSGHVAIPDSLRALLALESTAQVRIQPVNTDAHVPSQLTFTPLTEVPTGFTKDMLLIAITTWFENHTLTSVPLVITQGTIVAVPLMPDVSVRFLISFPPVSNTKGDPVFCLLSSSMIKLHKVSLVVSDQLAASNQPTNIARVAKGDLVNIDLPVPRVTLQQLGGIQGKIDNILHHIDICLAVKPLAECLFSSSPGLHNGGVLICGVKGIGKSTLGQALLHYASDWPLLAYVHSLDCKALKGKRIESIRKILEKIFHEASWRQPAIILLDDLDHMTGAPAGPEQEMSGEALYYTRTAEVLKDILNTEKSNNSRLVVIATSRSQSSLHASLVTSRGKHYFQEILQMSPPSQKDRRSILEAILVAKPVVNPQCLSDLDLEALSSQTEGYVAKDLDMVVDRAVHAHWMVNPQENSHNNKLPEITLTMRDFEAALHGFTPAALRNVALHKSGELGWSNVGGLQAVKKTLVETLQWPSKYPKLFASCPLRLRSGLLLYGAPGTGKTLLAGVVAKECGLNFISIKGPELLSKYIGASEQAVRDTFLRAQSAKPCILFFDEFDSLAPRRGHDSTGVTDRVVNQLLTQLDGVEGLEGVYVLGATSRPDLIDPALLRPGRLDKALLCPIPDEAERLEILQALTQNMTFDPDVDLTQLTTQCEHFTGADFKALLYNAQLEAIHECTGVGLQGQGQLEEGQGTELINGVISHGKSQQEGEQELQSCKDSSDNDIKKSSNEVGLNQVVLEKPLPEKRVLYIPSLEEGSVSLSHDQEQQYLEQYDQTKLPSGESSRKPAQTVVIRQRHLVTAAQTMGPSVSLAERKRYQGIYETFVASRGGNFSDQSQNVGKKATLA